MDPKVEQVKRICRRRYYAQYFLEILRGLGSDEWMFGEQVCRIFDEMCNAGIPNRKGGYCKGSDHARFKREVLGNGDGLLIECDAPVAECGGSFFPWYKTRKFRINPYYHAAVNSYLD